MEEAIDFYDTRQKILNNVLKSDYVCLTGDFIAREGKLPIALAVGTFGEATLNRNGQELLQFAFFSQLKISVTFIRERDLHKYAWVAREQKSLIDYVIVNN